MVRCEDPGNPENGQRMYVAGATVSYTCNEGYTLVGQPRRVCQPNGEFSGEQPSCIPIESKWVHFN